MKHLRLTALTLIFMANILMLAHAVIPHFHHDGIVCFSIENIDHQQDCSDKHSEHNCCTHNKKGHHHGISDKCDLIDIAMRQDNAHDDTVPCSHCLTLYYSFYTLNEFFLEQPQFGERFRQKPYLENYIPPFVGSISSLRAPPFSYFLV